MAAVGDEVLFHTDDRWIHAEVVIAWTDRESLTLLHAEGSTVATHGAHIHGWLTYEEAAQYAKDHAAA
jgi:hypothetical protein